VPGCVVATKRAWRALTGAAAGRASTRSAADVAESVRPCVKAQKNDDRDAEAIAAAATRPTAVCRAKD